MARRRSDDVLGRPSSDANAASAPEWWRVAGGNRWIQAKPGSQRPARGPAAGAAAGSRYERIWNTTAVVTAATWIAVAILQTPWAPLFALATAIGAYGGVLFVRAPISTRRGRRQYLAAALGVAGLVLVMAGVRQHFLLGLTVFSVLACSSPSLIRWVAGD
jgi:hypothetical protein